jgi:putative ABC transport system permease protein
MMFLQKLTLANLAHRKVRVALTIAAIALSVSLVVSVTGGYTSVEQTAFTYLIRYMGSHDGQVTRTSDPHATIDEAVADQLAADPDIRNVESRLEMMGSIIASNGEALWPTHVIGVLRPQDRRVEAMAPVEGGWFDSSEGDVCVVDQVAARRLYEQQQQKSTTQPTSLPTFSFGVPTTKPVLDAEKLPHVHVGDTLTIPGPNEQMKLRIVGIVHKPAFFASQMQTVYVPMRTLQKLMLPGKPPQVSRIMVDLKTGVSSEAVSARWKLKLAQIDPTLQMRMTSENRSKLEENLQAVHLLSYMGGAVSMLAAAFIVFSALSMGVSERQRSLAMLRAVGALRTQLGWLVLAEGLMLAIVGILIGIPLGWLWLKFLSLRFEDLFKGGVVMSWGGVAFASFGSLAAALAAGLLPAWSAMRTSPLEAMMPLAAPSSRKTPWVAAVFGLLLISVDPIIGFAPWERIFRSAGVADPGMWARTIVLFPHFAIGLPTLMAGFFLLAPIFVVFVERVCGPIVAAMFGLRFAILRQQLSGGIWRAAGTASALMVGLAVLVVMQTQGHTMLEGWQLPTRFPDVFIVSGSPGGLTPGQLNRLRNVQGIVKTEVLPIAITSPEYGSSLMAVYGAAIMPNATMFFGIEPDLAFKMMELDFRDGNPTQATEMLKTGRHVVITDELHQLKGLKVGDKLPLKTAKHGIVEYTVAGVVWSPGIDVMVSNFDLGRQFDQRTAASVFGSLEDARNDFGVQGIYLVAANLQSGVDREKLTAQINKHLGTMGLAAYDIRHIKAAIHNGFERLLLLVSTVAFAAMAVASLGVTNTIMASIRSRRWQFGIFRSVGVTRSQLLRLVLAEALLLGIVGCGLGVAAGIEMAIDARQESGIVLGYKPPVTIPWNYIVVGTSVVLLISLIASIAPAINLARSEPLDLLQAGRAAT